MKIFSISDLHTEGINNAARLTKSICDRFEAVENEDVLVLAGDLGYPLNQKGEPSEAYYEALAVCKDRFRHVILVPGNHEYYRAREFSLERTDSALRTLCDRAGVYLLQRDSVTLNGVLFLGCTLWSKITEAAYATMKDSKHVFNEHQEYLQSHITDLLWLTERIAESRQPTVVVTHHLPSYRAISEEYKDHPANSGFASHLDSFIQDYQAKLKLWCTGHTHKRKEIKIGSVPIIVNPIGYRSEVLYANPKWTGFDIITE
jgi:DNA repair exonuclease SbcCD nuclease subunit